MTADILKRIEEKRLARNGLGSQPNITGEGDVEALGGLPPAPTPEDVADVALPA